MSNARIVMYSDEQAFKTLEDKTPQTVKKRLDKWAAYGLLEGLPEYEKLRLANHFEAAAQTLLETPIGKSKVDEENLTASMVESLIFPVLRRIRDVLSDKNLVEIMNDFYNFCHPIVYAKSLHFIDGDNGRDLEAEVCHYFETAVRIRRVDLEAVK